MKTSISFSKNSVALCESSVVLCVTNCITELREGCTTCPYPSGELHRDKKHFVGLLDSLIIMEFNHDCWINKGIRSSFDFLFDVTKVKILVNKVLKTLFQKKTLVTPNDPKYPNLIPLSASTKGKSLPGVLLYWVSYWNRIGTLLTSKKVPSLSEKGAKLIVETIWTYILHILKFGRQCLPNYKYLIIRILQYGGHCPPISELQMCCKQNSWNII